MKLPHLLAYILSFAFGFHSLGQTDFLDRRRAVHLDPRAYSNLDPTGHWLDKYSSMLGYHLRGDYDSARYQLNFIDFSSVPPAERAWTLLVAGRIYRYYSENQRALASIDSASQIFSSLGDDAGLYMATVDLIEHYRSVESFIEAGDLADQLHLLDNDATIPTEYKSRLLHREAAMRIEIDNQIDKAEALLLRSIELAKEAEAPWQEATAKLNLGYYYYLRGGSSDYLKLINESSRIWRNLGYELDLAMAQINQVRVYVGKLNDYDRARRILRELQEEGIRKDWTLLNSYVWLERKSLYESQGKLDSAIYAYEQYHEYRTALLREQLRYINAETMAKLGVEIARNQLLKTTAEKEKTEESLASEKFRSKLFIIIAIALAIILLIMGWVYWRVRRLNVKISRQTRRAEIANEKLETALEQKDLIFRELHHRVKNNLANLSGLLYLQQRSLESEEARNALLDSRNRIQAISAIHKSLYETEDLIEIDLQSYLEELIPSLMTMYDEVAQKVKWNVNCRGVNMEIDKALPLAMIINEILTNSLKYAFNDRSKGLIEVTGEADQHGWTIHVKDDGPGLPPEMDWEKSESLGVKLIHVLSEDINVTIQYTNDKQGSIYTLKYEEEKDD